MTRTRIPLKRSIGPLAVLLLASCLPARAAQDDLSKRPDQATLEDFSDALFRWEEVFSSISVEGTLTAETARGKPNASKTVSAYVYKARPECEKYEKTFDPAEVKDKELYRRVACMNANYSFMLDQESEKARYTLKDFTEGVNFNISGSIDTNTRFMKYVYNYVGVDTWSLLKDPSFTLKRVAEEEKDGKKLVRIEFTLKPEPRFELSAIRLHPGLSRGIVGRL